MNRKLISMGGTLFLSITLSAQERPNIVIINADDLGFGDVSCYGATEISTPNVDRLSEMGLRHTNMHTTSATSTPSRFSLLTGKYAWRVEGTGVAPGDAAMIVTPQMQTLPQMLQGVGYQTAAVGKWHLGLGSERGKQNWNGEITPALKDIGFGYSFIMAATGDRVPCVYIEDGRVVDLDPNDPIYVSYSAPFEGESTGKDNPDMLKLHPSHGHDQTIINGISRIGYMKGGESALWVDEDIADRITEKAVEFIEQSSSDSPFFLYFATNDVHVPRAPHERFVGKSGMGARGDAILEFDWSVGEVVAALERKGVLENTLIILTSDNGPVIDDGYADQAVELLGDHTPWGEFRGGKYSIFEAGTHVIGIVRWNKEVKKGKSSSAAISQVDLYRSLAQIAGAELSQGEAMDSQDMSRALLGRDKRGRDYLIKHAGTLSITRGDWKYIKAVPGVTYTYNKYTDTELGTSQQPQLYNIKDDIGETTNLADRYPKIVEELDMLLESEVAK